MSSRKLFKYDSEQLRIAEKLTAYRKWMEARERLIIAAHNRGMYYIEIAHEMGITRRTVAQVITRTRTKRAYDERRKPGKNTRPDTHANTAR